MRNRVLFVLKRRRHPWNEGYGGGGEYSYEPPDPCGEPDFYGDAYGEPDCYGDTYSEPDTYGSGPRRRPGLRNSIEWMVRMLTHLGIEAKLVEVVNGNYIDREVRAWKPTHVLIEAYWLIPELFDLLMPRHPRVSWIVRNHSEVPFLAQEGIAFGWTAEYLKRGVELMCNSPRAQADLRTVAHAVGASDRLVTYGPNHYPIAEAGMVAPLPRLRAGAVNVGCFGAIRPLKNHVLQAVAALEFARDIGRPLRFHVNGTRLEGGAGSERILKNLRNLFAATKDAKLVEHPWMTHGQFLSALLRMDVVAQVTMSETFNLVSADAASRNVPVVVSPEVPWIGSYAHADPTDGRAIAAAMLAAWQENPVHRAARQRRDLAAYCCESERLWKRRFG